MGNRIIKFRAWDIKEKKFIPIANIHTSTDNATLRGIQVTWSGEEKKSHEIELMQFTGLLDSKKNEIYEGDICDGHSDGIGVIEWTDFDGGYNYVFVDENIVGIWEVLQDGITVIGNKFQNPELLTP